MALSESDKRDIETWFGPWTRETENYWVAQLNTVVPIYMEHGYTKSEAAILFMLSTIFNQLSSIKEVLQRGNDE